MEINTHRLYVVALTSDQLETLATDVSALEQELNCTYQGPALDEDFCSELRRRAVHVKAHPEQGLWHTAWLILRKSDRIALGYAAFCGPANEKGEVQFVYALGNLHFHMGYMTETIYEMCNWAKQQPGIRYFLAETEDDNFAAQRVLRRCNFIEWGGEKNIRWCRSATASRNPGWNILAWGLNEL